MKHSTEILVKALNSIKEPGVALEHKKDVPYYSVDEDNPEVIIRTLNGVLDIGALVDGEFVVDKNTKRS